jgi:branched-chain amino acid transport system ATP-binding protein
MSMPLLQAAGMNAFYGDFQALFDIEFSLSDGEILGLIGANGAGKTTLLRAIVGVLPVPPLAINFAGRPIGGLRTDQILRLGIAMVPEDRKLFPSLTVEENLRLGGYAKRPGAWTLDRIYALFPVLRERRSAPATQLSGGQQQIVAIGRALMSNPRILLCDEISLGLTPIVIADVYSALTAIRNSGTSLIIVEQDIAQITRAADRLYCLREGKFVLHGRGADLNRKQIGDAYFGTLAEDAPA